MVPLYVDSEMWMKILDDFPQGITLSLDDGIFYIYNKTMVDLTGYTKEEANDAQDFISVLFPDPFQQKKANEQLHELLSTGVSQTSEMRIVTKQDVNKTVMISSSMLEHGGKKFFLSIYHDVTSSKIREEELEHLNSRLHTLVETIPDIIYFKDFDGRNVIVNKAFEERMHVSRKDVIGKTDKEIFPPELAEYCVLSDSEVIMANEPVIFEEEQDTPSGKTYFETFKAPLYENGRFAGVLGVSRDITEKRLSEQKIKDSEKQFRSIFEGSSDGILGVDTQTRQIIFVNPKICQLTGYSDEELKAFTIDDIHRPEDLEYVHDQFKQQAEGKISVARDIPVLTKTKDIVYCDINAAPLEHGGRQLLVGFFRDITERKQADKLKSQFLSITSHELRTPLTPVRAQLQLLLKQIYGPVTEKQQHAFEIILRNTDRLNRLINDILDFSKLQSDSMKFHMEESNLNDVVKNSVETLKPRFDEKKVKLVLEQDPVQKIVFDGDRIGQVILNLLSNALKFTDPAGTVTVKLVDKKTYASISVQDSGIGIDQKDHKRIFSPFEQVDATFSRNHDGTGLGLAICRGIVENHGGNIGLRSSTGKGTIFTFTIPYDLEPAITTTSVLKGPHRTETFKKAWDLNPE